MTGTAGEVGAGEALAKGEATAADGALARVSACRR